MPSNDDGTADATSSGGLPSLDAWEDPDDLVTGGPIRERLLDVILQTRDPETVATIADRADCDPETARTYLEWFADLGIVREHTGRPVRYDRNEDYLRWRRIQRIRQEYTADEIATELEAAVADLQTYRDRFDAASPDQVSLETATAEVGSLADAWSELSDWRTLQARAELLDAARRTSQDGGGATAP